MCTNRGQRSGFQRCVTDAFLVRFWRLGDTAEGMTFSTTHQRIWQLPKKLRRWLSFGVGDAASGVPEWGKQARQLTGGVGVDHVVEVGGGGTIAQSLKAIRIGGQISVIGNLAGGSTELNLIPILMQNVRLQGIIVGSREGFEAMNRAIAHHEMRPVIDRVFPFAETLDAFRYMAAGKHLGKVCIEI